jgi:hypothetical protein
LIRSFFALLRYLRLVVLFNPGLNRDGLVVRPMKSFPFDWRAFLFLSRFMLYVYIIYSVSKDVYYKGFTF